MAGEVKLPGYFLKKGKRMEKGKVAIYALLCPDTLEIRYVGQTINPRQRYAQHMNNAKQGQQYHVYNWIRKAQIGGKCIPMIILQSDAIEDVDETLWIELCKKAGCRLTNQSKHKEHPSGGRKEYCSYCGCQFETYQGCRSFCSDQCRFMSKVQCEDIEDDTKCWIWTGKCIGKNPFFGARDGASISSKYFVWHIFIREEIPEDRYIRITCGNPKCVNPDHLEISHSPTCYSVVGNNPVPYTGRKISSVDAKAIVDNYKKGDSVWGAYPLSRKFNVTPEAIYRIVTKSAKCL